MLHWIRSRLVAHGAHQSGAGALGGIRHRLRLAKREDGMYISGHRQAPAYINRSPLQTGWSPYIR